MPGAAASLVEDAAAATESMKEQAGTLLDLVGCFRTEDGAPMGEAGFAPSLPAPLDMGTPQPIRVRGSAEPPTLMMPAGRGGLRGM